MFKHSFTINSLKHGVYLRRLQLVLGHYSIYATAVYLRLNDLDLQEVRIIRAAFVP